MEPCIPARHSGVAMHSTLQSISVTCVEIRCCSVINDPKSTPFHYDLCVEEEKQIDLCVCVCVWVGVVFTVFTVL
jgi:hypothetical protein